jgi:hypothetical protein
MATSSYTTTTNKLKITELDFDAIKAALKTYLKGQDVFVDYDFEGSALSILLDVLAYNTHYNGFYTNMLASEMFMDSASLRTSVVSLAKHLGYTPASKKGAIVDIDIALEGDAGTSVLIPKGAKFTSKIAGETYTFLATKSKVAVKDLTDNKYKAKNVQIREGIAFSKTYTAAGTATQLFEIPNEQVDIDTIVVAAGGEVFQKAEDITEIKKTDKVYFLQEGRDGKYEIYFGDGVIGKMPDTSDQVVIEYSISVLGSSGNEAKKFTLAETLSSGLSGSTIVLSAGESRSSGGAERETVSTIRLQAPQQNALQKRIVTADDYRARLVNDYNIVDSVRVWGGEDNDPPQFGKVFISIKPKTGYVLSDAEKERVKTDILKKRNMVTISPEFVDPDYLNLVLDVRVAYDPRTTTQSSDQIKAKVIQTIASFGVTDLNNFDQYLRNSALSNKIDSSDISIKNSLVDVRIKKAFKPILKVRGTHTLNFDNALYRPHTGHMSILTSTGFSFLESRNCTFIDQDGIVKVIRYRSTQDMSYDIVHDNIGTIDYITGKVVIDGFRPLRINDGSDYIKLIVKPNLRDIMPKGNTILTINESDVVVTMVDDTDIIESNKVQGY